MTLHIPSWIKRLPEVAVGLLALSISALTLWMCLYSLRNPGDSPLSPIALWALLGALAAAAIWLAVLGLRLIVPQLRVNGQHLFGLRGLVVFGVSYGLIVILGILLGGEENGRLVVAVAVLLTVGILIRDRLQIGAGQ
jgi:hypothetical protein